MARCCEGFTSRSHFEGGFFSLTRTRKGTLCTFRNYGNGCLQLVAEDGHWSNDPIDKTHRRQLLWLLDHFQPLTNGGFMTTKHDFDAYLDTQGIEEPDYHEQIAVMHEVELERETALMQRGAIDALQNLTVTLSALCLQENVSGDYFLGLHSALEIVRGNLDMRKGGVA
jgi:hypothetical protein